MKHKVTLDEVKQIGEITRVIISHASAKNWKRLSLVCDLANGDKFFLIDSNLDGISKSQKAWNLDTAIKYYNEC